MNSLLDLIAEEIKSLPASFSTHELIIRLAQKHQHAYINALSAKLDTERPFQSLHSNIGKYLKQQSNLIREIDKECCDSDIFGQISANSRWEKLI